MHGSGADIHVRPFEIARHAITRAIHGARLAAAFGVRFGILPTQSRHVASATSHPPDEDDVGCDVVVVVVVELFAPFAAGSVETEVLVLVPFAPVVVLVLVEALAW